MRDEVLIEVPESDHGLEVLRAEAADTGGYRIRSVPVFLYGISRGAVVDNGDKPRRPNPSLFFASVSTQSSRADRFDSARLGCRRLAPPSAPLTTGAFVNGSHHATPHAQEGAPHICTNWYLSGSLQLYVLVKSR